MNIEIANRLVELRKKSGLSQEDLAAKLGLSRQAVSKWERAEASPDTDNLICLAKLYGVSLDSLLNTNESIDEIVKEQVKVDAEQAKPQPEAPKEEKTEKSAPQESSKTDGKQAKCDSSFEGVHIDSTGIHFQDKDDKGSIDNTGIHVFSKDGSEVHIDSTGIHAKDGSSSVHVSQGLLDKERKRRHRYHVAESIVTGSIALLSTVAYILLGTLYPDHFIGWGVCWLVFLAIPLAASFVEALRKRRFCSFAFPVLVAGVYVMFGLLGNPYFGLNLWHPYWVIFFSIPLYYIIFSPIDHLIHDHGIEIGRWSCSFDDDDDCDDDDDDDVKKKKADAIDVDSK
jgi:transcriptional regulator with XRE-family HTH domain